MELVLDSVYDGLCDEIVGLREIRKVLKERILNVKGIHNMLDSQLTKIDQDLQNKEHSLSTDVKCLDNRIRLKQKSGNTCERAIEFSNIQNQI